MRTIALALFLAFPAACGGTDHDATPLSYVFPPATVEWSQPSYVIPSGGNSVAVEVRITWDVDPIASGSTVGQVTAEALGWENGGAPNPNVIGALIAFPCRPCIMAFTIARLPKPTPSSPPQTGTWTFRATVDPYSQFTTVHANADATVTLQ